MDELDNYGEKSGGRTKDTLFRVTFQNQINHIRIADNKANMIIRINSLIISLVILISGLGKLSQLFEYNTNFILVPIVIIILTSLFSMVFAVEATKPHIIKSRKKLEVAEKASLLFFGNIKKETMDNYIALIQGLLKSKDRIYENMIIDIYNQGVVLSKKYYLLRISYTIFMYGFVLGVLAFLATVIFR